jgi:4-hydroxy-3-methylbut-2-enyl diphosphate reductase
LNVIKITPRGYCYGVISALNLVQEAAANPELPRPLYVLGMIVHNEHLTKAIADLGVITLESKQKTRLELLDEIDRGTVIFTAHGVSPAVRQKAAEKGLHCIDASCRDVLKTHSLMEKFISEGYDIFYLGKEGHPETEGALGVDDKRIHLITKVSQVESLKVTNPKIMITNQTTMSLWDVYKLAEAIKKYYPQAEFIKEVCNATQVRQEAVAEKAKGADLTLVVGDPHSNNTARLAQISEEMAGVPAKRIGALDELDLTWLQGAKQVAVTSGASTPTPITKEVIDFLEQYRPEDPSTWDTRSKIPAGKILMNNKNGVEKA